MTNRRCPNPAVFGPIGPVCTEKARGVGAQGRRVSRVRPALLEREAGRERPWARRGQEETARPPIDAMATFALARLPRLRAFEDRLLGRRARRDCAQTRRMQGPKGRHFASLRDLHPARSFGARPFGACIRRVRAHRGRARPVTFGPVSELWLSENRLGALQTRASFLGGRGGAG